MSRRCFKIDAIDPKIFPVLPVGPLKRMEDEKRQIFVNAESFSMSEVALTKLQIVLVKASRTSFLTLVGMCVIAGTFVLHTMHISVVRGIQRVVTGTYCRGAGGGLWISGIFLA